MNATTIAVWMAVGLTLAAIIPAIFVLTREAVRRVLMKRALARLDAARTMLADAGDAQAAANRKYSAVAISATRAGWALNRSSATEAVDVARAQCGGSACGKFASFSSGCMGIYKYSYRNGRRRFGKSSQLSQSFRVFGGTGTDR